MIVTSMTAMTASLLKKWYLADSTAAISTFLRFVQILNIDIADPNNHDQQYIGKRTGFACLPLGEGHIIEFNCDKFRGRSGTAAGHDKGQVKGLKGLHGSENDGNEQERGNQRQGNLPERKPP
jgi:hypothetical protein